MASTIRGDNLVKRLTLDGEIVGVQV